MTPGRKGVEQKENCMSKLLLLSKHEQFGKEAWKVSCETTSLWGSKKDSYFFCASCLVDGYFSLHGNVLEHCTSDSCFLRLRAYYRLVGIHLALYERSWGAFNHDPLISSISQSTGFLWTVCWMWVLWSKCMCVPDRLRGGGLHLNLLPCELGNRVGKHACWKVLLMCFLVI